MVDVFQALLPQGAVSKGGLQGQSSESNKSGIGSFGAVKAQGQNSEQLSATGEPEPSFKEALQFRLTPAKVPPAPVLPPESTGLMPNSQTLLSNAEGALGEGAGETSTDKALELLPATGEQTVELASAGFLFLSPQELAVHTSPKETDIGNAASFATQNASGLNSLRFYHSGASAIASSEGVVQAGQAPLASNAEGEPISEVMFSRGFTGLPRNGTSESLIQQNSLQGAMGSTGSLGAVLPGLFSPQKPERMAGTVFAESLSVDTSAPLKAGEHGAGAALSRQATDLPSTSLSLNSPEAAGSPEALKMSLRFGQAGWAEQLAERTANLAGQNIKQAEVQLNPQELGAIHIKISVSQEQAAVTFAAQNAQVREAIDQTLHRLRDAFEGSGLELVQADVHDQQAGGDTGEETEQGPPSPLVEADDSDTQTLTVSAAPSGIDHFV